ncbi:MAG: hypothetical protein IKK33_03325 [Lachnospiraceae bacterium]|nr:hypothetical protein [Lachnospiraceae bacterium]
MREKKKEIKTWDTMTYAERGAYILQVEESIRQYGNKELLLLYKLMLETGIRFGDVLELKEENVKGRELQVIESKFGGKDYYRNPDGSLPVISGETVALLEPDEEGKFFQHDKRYYVVMLRKAFPSKAFNLYYLRQYVIEMKRIQKKV